MPYNGAGVFTSLGVPEFPAVSGEFILASYFNANLTDIFTGLSLVLTRDGQSAPTANLPMANFTFTALGAATLAGNPLVYGQSNASLTSLTLTGILTLPTPASNISTTQAVNAEWVSTYYATKNDAVLTGVPTAPTAALGTNTAQLATMAALKTQADLLALANDTVLTGVPTAPTAAPGTNTTQLATTAFVAAQAFSAALPSQAGNAGKFVTTNGTAASWAFTGIASVTTATTSTTLTSTPTLLRITPTGYGVTVTLPDATTCQLGGPLHAIDNKSGYQVRVVNNAGALVGFVPGNSVSYVALDDKTTAAGVWAVSSSDLVGISAELLTANFTYIHSVVDIGSGKEVIVGSGPSYANLYAVVYDKVNNVFGSAVLVRTATFTTNCIQACSPDGATAVVLSVPSAGTVFHATALTVSGTTITVNTPVTPGAYDPRFTPTMRAVKVGSACFFACTYVSGGPGCLVFGVSVSGTVPSVSAAVLTGGVGGNCMIATNGTAIIAAYTDTTAGTIKYTAYSVAGRTLTLLSTVTRTATVVNWAVAYSLVYLGTGRFLGLHGTSNLADTAEVCLLNLSGSTLTASTATAQPTGTTSLQVVGTDKAIYSDGGAKIVRLVDSAGTLIANTLTVGSGGVFRVIGYDTNYAYMLGNISSTAGLLTVPLTGTFAVVNAYATSVAYTPLGNPLADGTTRVIIGGSKYGYALDNFLASDGLGVYPPPRLPYTGQTEPVGIDNLSRWCGRTNAGTATGTSIIKMEGVA